MDFEQYYHNLFYINDNKHILCAPSWWTVTRLDDYIYTQFDTLSPSEALLSARPSEKNPVNLN